VGTLRLWHRAAVCQLYYYRETRLNCLAWPCLQRDCVACALSDNAFRAADLSDQRLHACYAMANCHVRPASVSFTISSGSSEVVRLYCCWYSNGLRQVTAEDSLSSNQEGATLLLLGKLFSTWHVPVAYSSAFAGHYTQTKRAVRPAYAFE